MKTRCPGCSTTYRVDEETIIEAGGMVRCYRCDEVFNAFEFGEFEEPGAGASPYGLEADAEDHGTTPAVHSPTTAENPPAPRNTADTEIPFDLPPLFAKTPVNDTTDDDLPFEVPSDLPELEVDEDVALGTDELFAEPDGTPPWQVMLLLLLAAGLAGQWLWFEREHYFAGNGPLVFTCQWIPCPTTTRRAPGAYRVVEQPVIAPASDVRNALQFRVRFANDADFAQPLPDIQVALTDVNGTLLSRRRLKPREYLFPRPLPDHLVASGEVVTIDLLFEDPGNLATGFEIRFL